jgi:hypothetical protein
MWAFSKLNIIWNKSKTEDETRWKNVESKREDCSKEKRLEQI